MRRRGPGERGRGEGHEEDSAEARRDAVEGRGQASQDAPEEGEDSGDGGSRGCRIAEGTEGRGAGEGRGHGRTWEGASVGRARSPEGLRPGRGGCGCITLRF